MPPLTVPGVPGQFGITARRIEGGHVELGLQRVTGVHWGERLLPRSRRLDTPRYGSDRVYTSSIDLVDEGPAVCQLGLIVSPGEQCRFPDTREVFVVEPDGSAHYPREPWSAARDSERKAFPDGQWRIYVVVSSLHGLGHDPQASAPTHGVLIQRLEQGRYIFMRLGLDLLRPINGADCVQGLLVSLGGYCAVPGSSAWFIAHPSGLAQFTIGDEQLSWIGDDRLKVDDDLPHADGRWIVHFIALSGGELLEIGRCTIGLVLHPGEECHTGATGPFQVHQNGLAVFGDAIGRERVQAAGIEVTYAHGLASHDFRAGRRADGGFRITAMRLRVPAREQQVRRDLGDCASGMILGPGDGCRHPRSGGILLVDDDGQIAPATHTPLHRYASAFIPWDLSDSELILHRPLSDGRHVVLRVATDQTRSIGNCAGRVFSPPCPTTSDHRWMACW